MPQVLVGLVPAFDAHGVVPIGYAAFGFALGVTAGTLIRRALPATALTLAIFAAVQVAMPLAIRPSLFPPAHMTQSLAANFSGQQSFGLASHDYGIAVSYLSTSRYWPIQWTETGIYLALALVLSGFSYWRLGRRLP